MRRVDGRVPRRRGANQFSGASRLPLPLLLHGLPLGNLLRPRGVHAQRLVVPLREVRRPRRVAEAALGVLRRELEQRLERAGVVVDAGAGVADRAQALGHGRTVNRSGSTSATSSHRAASTRGRRASAGRVGARHGAIPGVLVVVEEHADPLLLPPRGRGDAGHPPLDLAGEGQGGAAGVVKPLPRSTRTFTWMPRFPLVFGKPLSPCSARTSRAIRATPRTSSNGTPGVGSRSTRSSSGWSRRRRAPATGALEAPEVHRPRVRGLIVITSIVAVRPLGNFTVAVRTQSGAPFGMRF